jgi:hypothetical protein
MTIRKTISAIILASAALACTAPASAQRYYIRQSVPKGPSAPAATPAPTPVWNQCATENGRCSFTGTATVRYGANGVYATRTATNGIDCNNGTFGDPLNGVVKSCDYLR